MLAITLGEVLILALGLYVGINIGVKIVIARLENRRDKK